MPQKLLQAGLQPVGFLAAVFQEPVHIGVKLPLGQAAGQF